MTPEQEARQTIESCCTDVVEVSKFRDQLNLRVSRGVVVQELPLEPGNGKADYLLGVDKNIRRHHELGFEIEDLLGKIDGEQKAN